MNNKITKRIVCIVLCLLFVLSAVFVAGASVFSADADEDTPVSAVEETTKATCPYNDGEKLLCKRDGTGNSDCPYNDGDKPLCKKDGTGNADCPRGNVECPRNNGGTRGANAKGNGCGGCKRGN